MAAYTLPVFAGGKWVVETPDGTIFVDDEEYREKHQHRILEYANKAICKKNGDDYEEKPRPFSVVRVDGMTEEEVEATVQKLMDQNGYTDKSQVKLLRNGEAEK